MAEFAYNITKNAITGHTLFKLNCDYDPRVIIEEDVDPHSRSCFDNKLVVKLRELMKICC